MPQKDEPTSVARKSSAAMLRKTKANSAAAERRSANGELFSLTVNVADGRVVTLERVDAGGTRHKLSAAERNRLARAPGDAPLQRLVEQAFEAGIECVLGRSGEDPAESKGDAEFSRMLLRTLMERSGAGKLADGETLNRAMVGTLIGEAAAAESAATQ